MNGLLRLRKDMVVTELVPFKYLLYVAMLSSVVPYEGDDDCRYGVYSESCQDLYDYFSDWNHSDDRRNEVLKALKDLEEEGLTFYDKDGRVYLGEYRGRRFFTFEVKNSMSDYAMDFLKKEIKRYKKSSSAVTRSRGKYIEEQITELLRKGVDQLLPSDFTNLHGFLYEIYTGGEHYIVRSKIEYYQTTNMLKAYDKFTTFAIMIEAVLNYDKYRKNGIPTLTNVAYMKDDVFKALSKSSDEGSKDYMRDITSAIGDETF